LEGLCVFGLFLGGSRVLFQGVRQPSPGDRPEELIDVENWQWLLMSDFLFYEFGCKTDFTFSCSFDSVVSSELIVSPHEKR